MAYKIVIDAGHGGADPGAVSGGRQEKDDTLGLALAVGKYLQKGGIDVIYTELLISTRRRLRKPRSPIRPEPITSFPSIVIQSGTDQYQGVETLVYDKSASS